jgi:hypothetical protein
MDPKDVMLSDAVQRAREELARAERALALYRAQRSHKWHKGLA